eukprot:Gb_07627 [translate_table: standard]
MGPPSYQMLKTGIQPDNVTFPFVLKTCGSLSALQEGKEIHCHIVKVGFESDLFVGVALVHIHANEDLMLFNQMQLAEVIHVLQMNHPPKNHETDAITIVSVLQACSHVRALKEGKAIHNHMIRTGLDSHVFVETALMHIVGMPVRHWHSLIECNEQSAMISGHVNEALNVMSMLETLAGEDGEGRIMCLHKLCAA